MACGCIVSVELFFDTTWLYVCAFRIKWYSTRSERTLFFSTSSPVSHTTAATYISMNRGERGISHGILCLWLSHFLFSPTTIESFSFYLRALSVYPSHSLFRMFQIANGLFICSLNGSSIPQQLHMTELCCRCIRPNRAMISGILSDMTKRLEFCSEVKID